MLNTQFCSVGNHVEDSRLVTQRGLREQKREATAHALADAAFELAKTRGLDGFVIEDVVERAGYSRRTFANHFSCKEEAVASVVHREADAAAAALEDMPADMPLLDAVQAVLKRQLTADVFARLREVVDLARRYPSLEPHVLSVQNRMRQAAQASLRWVAGDRYSPTYVALLFGAVYGAVTAALEGDVDVRIPGQEGPSHPGSVDYPEFLDQTFSYLRSGF